MSELVRSRPSCSGENGMTAKNAKQTTSENQVEQRRRLSRLGRQRCGTALFVATIATPSLASAQTWTNLLQNSDFDTGTAAPWVARATTGGSISGVLSQDTYTTYDLTTYDPGGLVTDVEV